jgi:hypothetical protein
VKFWLGVGAGILAAWGAFAVMMWGEAHYYRLQAEGPKKPSVPPTPRPQTYRKRLA